MAAGLGITATQATFETSDSPVSVLAFYRDAMQQAHWDLTNTGYRDNLDKTLRFQFNQIRRKPSRDRDTVNSVEITAERTPEGRTRVTLVKWVFNA